MSETRDEVLMPEDQGELAGGGELGLRMREHDWAQTPAAAKRFGEALYCKERNDRWHAQ